MILIFSFEVFKPFLKLWPGLDVKDADVLETLLERLKLQTLPKPRTLDPK